MNEQSSDVFCSEIKKRLNSGDELTLFLDEGRLLIITAETGTQVFVPHNLKIRVLHISHYSRLSAQPGGRQLYYSIRRYFYWPTLAVDFFATLRRCSQCATNRNKLRRHTTEFKLFLAKEPLKIVSIEVLGELIRTP